MLSIVVAIRVLRVLISSECTWSVMRLLPQNVDWFDKNARERQPMLAEPKICRLRRLILVSVQGAHWPLAGQPGQVRCDLRPRQVEPEHRKRDRDHGRSHREAEPGTGVNRAKDFPI